MKRLASILLAAALLFSAALAGEMTGEDPTASLTEITLKVKELLDIPDTYTSFSSDYSFDNGVLFWNLYWSGGGTSASVTCDADAKIYSYYVYSESDGYRYSGYYDPSLPTVLPDEAQAALEAFLGDMVGADEGYVIQNQSGNSGLNEAPSYNFSGILTRGGRPTENTFYVTLRAEDMKVTSYSRGDSYMRYTDRGADEPKIDAEQAEAALRATYTMELRYVYDGSGTARLVYCTVPETLYIVDAVTGEVVEHTTQQIYFARGGEGESAAEDGAGLTPAETEGIAQLSGVKSQEELDAAVRAMPELGVTDEFKLTGANFYISDGDAMASLYYRAPAGDGNMTYKYISLDAKDMSFSSIYTDHPYRENLAYAPDLEAAAKTADEFLAKYFPDLAGHWVRTEAYVPEDPYEPVVTVAYVRVENGVRCDADTITVGVNTEIGQIDDVYMTWTKDATFPAVGEVAAAEAALDALFALGGAELFHANLYVDDLWKQLLAYRPALPEGFTGLDAYTLEPVNTGYVSDGGDIVYDDLEEAGEVAQTLALFDIGYGDGSFRGADNATLRDILTLVLTAGNRITFPTTDELILESAISNGILPRAEYDLDATVTRARFARMLVEMSGYGKAAPLSDIYVIGFDDGDQIAAEDLGFIAIARGMGVAAADSANAFHPNRPVTRAEAAAMLYAFLMRTI